MKDAKFSYCWLTSALLLVGCASYKGGAVEYKGVGQFANTQKTDGVQVGAAAMSESSKVKEIFYVDLTDKGYFPIELAIQNDGDAKVLIEKEAIELHSLAGGIIHPINVSVMTDEFEHNKIVYALLGFGIFSYMSADDANKKMAADWSSKEIAKEVIVSPGRKTTGFIYVKLPDGEKPTGMDLDVSVENLEKKGVQVVHLQL